MTYLHFVTLNTRTIDRVPLPQDLTDSPAVLDLARAMRDGRSPVTGHHDAALVIPSRPGPSLIASIYWRDVPLATIGVASRSRAAPSLWRTLWQSQVIAQDDDLGGVPPAPWCAVIVYPSLVAHPSAAMWLPTYELEIALAFLEHRNAA